MQAVEEAVDGTGMAVLVRETHINGKDWEASVARRSTVVAWTADFGYGRVEERSKGAAADATCRQDCAITLDQREASACIGSMEGGAVGE